MLAEGKITPPEVENDCHYQENLIFANDNHYYHQIINNVRKTKPHRGSNNFLIRLIAKRETQRWFHTAVTLVISGAMNPLNLLIFGKVAALARGAAAGLSHLKTRAFL